MQLWVRRERRDRCSYLLHVWLNETCYLSSFPFRPFQFLFLVHVPWSVPYAWSHTLDLEGHIFPKFFLAVIAFANYVWRNFPVPNWSVHFAVPRSMQHIFRPTTHFAPYSMQKLPRHPPTLLELVQLLLAVVPPVQRLEVMFLRTTMFLRLGHVFWVVQFTSLDLRCGTIFFFFFMAQFEIKRHPTLRDVFLLNHNFVHGCKEWQPQRCNTRNFPSVMECI